MSIQVGQEAPNFTLQNSNKEPVSLASFRGKKNVVLLFFPFAFTGVCTEEMCSTSGQMDQYEGLQAEVMGISGDSPFALKHWKEKEKITIPLLSDYEHVVVQQYGVQYESFAGYKGPAKRSAFVIDRQGIVQYAEVLESAKELPNFAQIKATLQRLS